MHQTRRSRRVVLVALVALLVSVPAAAQAHVTTASGPFRVTLGWGSEPPLTGLANSVEVAVSDPSGGPVSDLGDAPRVEVSFGDARISLPLVPAGRPGEFRAVLVPTRPGTYAFRVVATAEGRTIDAAATCSEATFECVTASTEVQFPAKDPSAGEIAQRLDRELSRAEEAGGTADSARTIAIAALVLAAFAIATALRFGLRARRG
jgi:hypothetical protein